MATRNYLAMAKRLQKAIRKTYGINILINSQQWYSSDKDCAITVYNIKQAVYDETKKRYVNIDLFKSYSQVQLVLFLRDYWYDLHGWDIPTDNPIWEELKKQYGETGKISDVEPDIRRGEQEQQDH